MSTFRPTIFSLGRAVASATVEMKILDSIVKTCCKSSARWQSAAVSGTTARQLTNREGPGGKAKPGRGSDRLKSKIHAAIED